MIDGLDNYQTKVTMKKVYLVLDPFDAATIAANMRDGSRYPAFSSPQAAVDAVKADLIGSITARRVEGHIESDFIFRPGMDNDIIVTCDHVENFCPICIIKEVKLQDLESPWIPVAERMPKNKQDVLVYNSSTQKVYQAQYVKFTHSVTKVTSYHWSGAWGHPGGKIANDVTHWMPLPGRPA